MNNFTSGKRFSPKTSKGATAALLVVSLLTFVFLAPFPAKGTVEKDAFLVPKTFSKLAEEASPAVVNIRTVKTIKGGGQVFRHFMRPPMGPNDPFHEFFERFFGDERQREFKQRSLGSGFIIDKEGYIVTNNHVIEDADEIRVQLRNEKEYDAEIVGRDPNTDLALIKIKGPKNLPVMKLGDSDTVKVGEWVVAIGNPFGLDHTVTAGIVSAKGRVIGAGPYDDFIQTDASINPGNSGGPLLNLEGEVIGINTAIVASGQGIGFAIPINMALGIVEQLRQTGEVTRGWLGVGIQDVKGEVAEYYGLEEGEGVLVAQVFPGDPAEKAGIQPQDIILEVNGKKVGSSRELSRLIADIGVGEDVRIKLLRNGKEKTISVTIAKREDTRAAAEKPRKETEAQIGIQVADLTPEMANRLNLPDTQGVVVVDVATGSKAEAAGIMQGDVIKEINHMPTHSVKAFKEALDKVNAGETLQMFILRKNMGFLVVKMTR